MYYKTIQVILYQFIILCGGISQKCQNKHNTHITPKIIVIAFYYFHQKTFQEIE